MAYVEFVSKLVHEGREAVYKAASAGIEPDHLGQQQAKDLYSYLLEYIKQYDDFPTVATIEGYLGIAVPPPPPEPLDFWIDRIQEFRVLSVLLKHDEKMGDAVQRRHAGDGVEILETTQRLLREQHLVVGRVADLFGNVHGAWQRYNDIKQGKQGVPFPWPSMTNETLGMWPKDLILVVARTGVGKCVDGDTELMDPKSGLVRKIRHVVRDHYSGADRMPRCPSPFDRIQSWSKDEGRLVRASIAAKVDTGVKECLEFVLASGKSVVVTPEHPFILPDGWRRADEVRIGETVGTPCHVGFPEAPIEMPSAELDLLAVMLADGSCTGHHVSFTKHDPEIVRIAGEAADEIGASTVRVRSHEYAFTGTGESKGKVNPVRQLLRAHGVDKTLSKNKHIPEAVFRLDRDQLARFLSVFWMCDGYVDNGPGIVLASERMLRQIAHLLLRFGIRCSVHHKPTRLKGALFDAWRLRVYSDCWETFAGEIALWGNKRKRMQELLRRGRNANVGSPRVWDGVRIRRYKRCQRHEKGVRGSEAWWWDSGLFWDPVEEIRHAGERRVFDLTVPVSECFVANDIVVHNTWTLILMALTAWKAGHKVLFATTEMSQDTLMQRFLAVHLRLPYRMLRQGKLPMVDEVRFENSLNELQASEGLYIIGGHFDFRVESVDAAIEECRPDLVILDGAYLLKVPGKTRTERMAEAFNELKRLAMSHEVPLVTTTQFNREAKKGKAQTSVLENIGLSDVGGWNADLAFALTATEEMEKAHAMGVVMMKGREVKIEPFEVNWDFDLMDFSEKTDDQGVDLGPDDDPIF